MTTVYPKKNITVKAGNLFQWDYGQTLQIKGVDLPSVYEVHFFTPNMDEAVSVIGDENGVQIPDELLETGSDINGWVFVKTEDYGMTKYSFTLLVVKRVKATDYKPEIPSAEGVEF